MTNAPHMAPGWWQASDGNWYPPEQHPSYVPPVPQTLPTFETYVPPVAPVPSELAPGGQTNRKTPFLWIGLAVVVVMALVAGVAFGASGGNRKAPGQSNSAPSAPVISGPALSALNQQFGSAIATERAASQASLAASNAALSDITKQNQRIEQDQTTVSSNSYGSGCSIADFSNYESCVQGEEQQAADAQNDEAAANAQIATDNQQFAAAFSTFETALSTFVGQLVATSWPPPMNEAVNNLVEYSRQYRSALAEQGAIPAISDTPQATITAVGAQATTAAGNFTDAINVVKADLTQLTTK
jgi:hypothetical protein